MGFNEEWLQFSFGSFRRFYFRHFKFPFSQSSPALLCPILNVLWQNIAVVDFYLACLPAFVCCFIPKDVPLFPMGHRAEGYILVAPGVCCFRIIILTIVSRLFTCLAANRRRRSLARSGNGVQPILPLLLRFNYVHGMVRISEESSSH